MFFFAFMDLALPLLKNDLILSIISYTNSSELRRGSEAVE